MYIFLIGKKSFIYIIIYVKETKIDTRLAFHNFAISLVSPAREFPTTNTQILIVGCCEI